MMAELSRDEALRRMLKIPSTPDALPKAKKKTSRAARTRAAAEKDRRQATNPRGKGVRL